MQYCKDIKKSTEVQAYPTDPRIGIVIGNFAATPYIHLQLECHKRFYSHIPLLIHDDASGIPQLSELATQYDVDFESNDTRCPPTLGDLSAFVGGLKWAEQKEIDILLKISRRWIFVSDFSKNLLDVALKSQSPTISNYTTAFNFGFRTECIALSVRYWAHPSFYNKVSKLLEAGQQVFVEAWMHSCAREYSDIASSSWLNYHQKQIIWPGADRYAYWELMGNNRCQKYSTHLWHDSHSAGDYAELAHSFCLPYAEIDFVDPNMGKGITN